MKVRIVSIITLILLTANAFAFPNGKIEKVSDDVLEDVYAQGFFTNWQIIGNFSGNTFNVAGDFTNKIRINANINSSPINLNQSVFLNGNAQQGAFIPVNAVNSQVNVPVNLVVIFGNNYGNIKINNILKAISH